MGVNDLYKSLAKLRSELDNEKLKRSFFVEKAIKNDELVIVTERHRQIGKTLLTLMRASETNRPVMVHSTQYRDIMLDFIRLYDLDVELLAPNDNLRGRDLRRGLYLDGIVDMDILYVLEEQRIPVWGGTISV